MNLKLLPVFAIVSALIFAIVVSDEVGLGIPLDKNENIYVTEWWDFIGIEKFTKTGEPATDFQIEDQSVFELPSDIAIDSDGILYVLEHRNLDIDYGENAGVHKIDTDGGYLGFLPIPDELINDRS